MQSNVRKVLIISYYWPPSGGAGVQRWLKTVKYLRDFNWEPIVYTVENPEAPVKDISLYRDIPEDIEILKTKAWEPYNLYRKFVGLKKTDNINAGFLAEKKKSPVLENLAIWLRGNFFIPDARVFWIRPSIKYLSQYLKANKVEAIVSTGPPHSMHLIAKRLSKKHKLPWLADFRDPWTDIDFYHQLKLSWVANRLHHRLEKSILCSADAVTVVGKEMVRLYQDKYKRPIHLITNGFDETDFSLNSPGPDAGKFLITHAGSIGNPRNPVLLWQVLSELIQEIPSIQNGLEIRLIGKIDLSVREAIEHAGLEHLVKYISYLPHDEVITELQKSNVLLLLINNTPNAASILTGKLFEYLATDRPILCIGPSTGDAAEILRETNAGFTVDFGDHDGMRSMILKLKTEKPDIQNPSRNTLKQRYSRKSLTGKIADLLNEITANKVS